MPPEQFGEGTIPTVASLQRGSPTGYGFTRISNRDGLQENLDHPGLVGAALTYVLWFRGIARLEPGVVASLGFLSPVTAILLGWAFLDQTLAGPQIVGVALVLGGIWLGQRGA